MEGLGSLVPFGPSMAGIYFPDRLTEIAPHGTPIACECTVYVEVLEIMTIVYKGATIRAIVRK
jgi:hypothetical protein